VAQDGPDESLYWKDCSNNGRSKKKMSWKKYPQKYSKDSCVLRMHLVTYPQIFSAMLLFELAVGGFAKFCEVNYGERQDFSRRR